MSLIEKHIELIHTLETHLVNITQRDMSYILEKSGELENFLRDEFPRSEVKNLLVVFRRELNDLRGQSLANALAPASVTQNLNNWVLRFQALLPDIEEYLKDESARKHLEAAAQEQLISERKIENAYQAFTQLSFDEEQRFEFNLALTSAKSLAFLVHGKPYHGQKWLYNRLLKVNERESLLHGDPVALHRVIDLAAKSQSDAIGDIQMDFATILGLHPRDPEEEIIRRLQENLQERNVLIAFKNPSPAVLSDIKNIYQHLVHQLAPALINHKLIFIFLLDRIEADAHIPFLIPIDAPLFRKWIRNCVKEKLQTVTDLYAPLLKEDDDCICQKIIELKRPAGGQFFGLNPKTEEDPAIPAETLIKKITHDQLNLDWEKCRQLWMPY